MTYLDMPKVEWFQYLYYLPGIVNEKVAPFPFALFYPHILPPWASTIPFEIYNPKLVPVSDLIANTENNFGKISGCMPVPKSFTMIIISSDSR